MLVKFNGASDAQAKWGRGKDPRKYLKVGETYGVTKTEGHTWHTLYYIKVKGESMPFNSVCFSSIE